jgi:hypothetical protein
MIERAEMGEYYGMWVAHETTMTLRDDFPGGWMGIGEDALGQV